MDRNIMMVQTSRTFRTALLRRANVADSGRTEMFAAFAGERVVYLRGDCLETPHSDATRPRSWRRVQCRVQRSFFHAQDFVARSRMSSAMSCPHALSRRRAS